MGRQVDPAIDEAPEPGVVRHRGADGGELLRLDEPRAPLPVAGVAQLVVGPVLLRRDSLAAAAGGPADVVLPRERAGPQGEVEREEPPRRASLEAGDLTVVRAERSESAGLYERGVVAKLLPKLLPRAVLVPLAGESSDAQVGSRPTLRRRSTKVTFARCSSRRV